MSEAADLARFVAAQDPVYDTVRRELAAGAKRSHWMWFVFPQVAGLGHSDMARRYAIFSSAEARAYLAHPVLGPRLRACTALVNRIDGKSIRQIFGSPDDQKFQSCMSLFAAFESEDSVFATALQQYFSGIHDEYTREFLRRGGSF